MSTPFANYRFSPISEGWRVRHHGCVPILRLIFFPFAAFFVSVLSSGVRRSSLVLCNRPTQRIYQGGLDCANKGR